jgi:hypothetical protein
MEEPDETKYVLGGCVVFDDSPDYKCLACGLEFHKRVKKEHGILTLEIPRFVSKSNVSPSQ